MPSSTAAVVPNPHHHNSCLPHWMQQSLEHLSMKTNLEEYGTSPPENESLFLHEGKLPNYSMAHLHKKPEGISAVGTNCSSLVISAKGLAPRAPRSLSVTPHHSASMIGSQYGDQVCPASAPQSEATTPSVSPHNSPTLVRKILSADLRAAGASTICKAGSSLTECARKARMVPVTRVTNFDLNAVSPTSW